VAEPIEVPEHTTQSVQAAVEGAPDTADVVEFLGAMIRDVIHRPKLYDDNGNRVIDEVTGKPAHDESEWQRFEELAIDEQADGEQLMEFVSEVMGVIAARPPKRRGISSASSPTTSPKSRASSSSPGMREIPGMVPVADIGRDL
jgi:hypothetical protein